MASSAVAVAAGCLFAVGLLVATSSAAPRDLHGKNWNHKELQNENLERCDLSEANLQWADLTNATLKGAKLRDADLRNARLSKADFTEADLRGAKLNKADLQDAKFVKANLEGAEVFLAYGNPFDEEGNKRARRALEDAGASISVMAEHNGDLSFKEANLRGAKLHGQLDGVDLRRADLRGANLSDTHNAGKASWRGAIYDETTRWPNSFEVAESGAVRGQPVTAESAARETSKPKNWSGKWMIKAEKDGAAEDGILTVKKDGTYSWDYSVKAQPIEGSWKTAKDGIILQKGEGEHDWLVGAQLRHPDRPDSMELKASDADLRRWAVPIEQ